MPTRLLFCWIALGLLAGAQDYAVQPRTVRQGETLYVSSTSGTTAARMNGRSIRLFPQPEGVSFGLMPVRAQVLPGSYPLEFLDDKGGVVKSLEVTVIDGNFSSQNVVLTRAVARLRPSVMEVKTIAAFRENVSDRRYWQELLTIPVASCTISAFGVKRLYNGKDSGDYHGGVDLRAAAGTPIRAAAAGVVRIVRRYNVHGGTVAIDHGQGLGSMYLHMSRFAVREGARVQAGQVIGYAGSTGRSTAPHLHWSIYVNSVPVNPAQWVPLEHCASRTPPESPR